MNSISKYTELLGPMLQYKVEIITCLPAIYAEAHIASVKYVLLFMKPNIAMINRVYYRVYWVKQQMSLYL